MTNCCVPTCKAKLPQEPVFVFGASILCKSCRWTLFPFLTSIKESNLPNAQEMANKPLYLGQTDIYSDLSNELQHAHFRINTLESKITMLCDLLIETQRIIFQQQNKTVTE